MANTVARMVLIQWHRASTHKSISPVTRAKGFKMSESKGFWVTIILWALAFVIGCIIGVIYMGWTGILASFMVVIILPGLFIAFSAG